MIHLFQAVLVLAIAIVAVPAVADDPATPDFQREIVPLLKQRCVACHGPAKRKAKLNLALPPGIRRGGENGLVVVSGSPEKSLLWQRVAADEMPEDQPLPANEKELLRRWIAGGAPGLPANVPTKPNGDEHWAFQHLTATKLPAVQDRSRVRTDLDLFVQARLEEEGLSLGPQADRLTLLRRVSYDLTGLPPTRQEIATYLSDEDELAYEHMIDRYLASPHYGERWGKYWLDAAGYADSDGYFGADTDRPLAYRYRDYVIRSINADKPWDRFIREQLAGDEIAGWSPEEGVTPEKVPLLEAVHFLRNSPDGTDSSDGNEDELRRDKYAVLEGTMEIMGNSLLGMTVGCARCHDHKFEPFKQRDYYQLQAVLYPAFNVQKWIKPKQRVAQTATKAELAQWRAKSDMIDKQIAARRDELAQWVRDDRETGDVLFEAKFDEKQAKLAEQWSNKAPGDEAPAGQPAINVDSSQAPGATIADGALRIVESRDKGDRAFSTRQVFDWTPEQTGGWIQVTFDLLEEGATAPYVGYFLSLRDFNDTRKLTGGNVLLDGRAAGGATVHLDYPGSDSKEGGTIGSAGYQPGRNYGVRVTNLGEGRHQLNQLVDGVPEEPAVVLSATDLPDGGFGFEYCCGRSFTIDNILVEQSSSDPERKKAQSLTAQRLAQRRSELEAAIKALETNRPEPPGKLAIVSDRSADPPNVPMLVRGDHKHPGEFVAAGGPHVLSEPDNPALFTEPAAELVNSTGRRLAFAQWLTRSDSRAAALLARVTVNRWWQYHFGTGIVATANNLGYSGASPTHPDLLEYLAGRFVAGGWSAKSVHRAILLSAAYRQSSRPHAAGARIDPDNRLIWRYPMRRLDAEAIRDAMLRASGELNSQMFGPYVPTQISSDGSVVVQGSGQDAFRRSVYLQQKRTQVVSMLRLFDSPSIVNSCTQRPRTTMPLQSLSLLNSEFVRGRASAMAQRLHKDAADADTFVREAFLRAMSRQPSDVELADGKQFLAAQPQEYPGREDAQRQAEVDYCHMLLASNPFLYHE